MSVLQPSGQGSLAPFAENGAWRRRFGRLLAGVSVAASMRLEPAKPPAAARDLFGELPVGYGCASLLNQGERAQARRLIEAAFDNGIRYFDVARMYGHGETEAVLGEAIAGNRSSVSIATKVGILPPSRDWVTRGMGKLSRLVAETTPALARHVPPPRDSLPRSNVFDAASMTSSLEDSLRALRTEYVDVLLLHGAPEDPRQQEGLREFSYQAKKDGKVRKFGVAAEPTLICALIDAQPDLFDIVQVEAAPNLPALPPGSLRIAHSVFSLHLQRVSRWLRAHPAAASSADLDPEDRRALGAVLLDYALHQSWSDMVLFSSSSTDVIASNASRAQRFATGKAHLGESRRTVIAQALS